MSEPGRNRTGSSAGSRDDSVPNTNWRAKSVLSRQSTGCPTQGVWSTEAKVGKNVLRRAVGAPGQEN